MDDTSSSIGAEKPSKKKLIWIILLVVALVASNTAWGLFYFNSQTNLQAQITKLNVQKLALQKELADEKKANKDSQSDAEWREIPELGVQYKLNDKTKDVTYVYYVDNGVKYITLSTLGVLDTADKEDSDMGDATFPVATIQKLSEADTETFQSLDENFETFKKNSPSSVKKIGQYYYVITGPNGLGTGKTPEAIVAAYDANAKPVFDSLEATD